MKVIHFCALCGTATEACDCGSFMYQSFKIGKNYRIRTWRSDYYITFKEDSENPIMEDGTEALMSGWKTVITHFEEVK